MKVSCTSHSAENSEESSILLKRFVAGSLKTFCCSSVLGLRKPCFKSKNIHFEKYRIAENCKARICWLVKLMIVAKCLKKLKGGPFGVLTQFSKRNSHKDEKLKGFLAEARIRTNERWVSP